MRKYIIKTGKIINKKIIGIIKNYINTRKYEYRYTNSEYNRNKLTYEDYILKGQYIYIPKEKGVRNPWGSTSGAKKINAERNSEIKEKFLNGTTKESLAEMYCLSVASIKKIIYGN